MLDHILISPGVRSANGALGLADCGLFVPFSDMIADGTPVRFRNGSGYSDHLPLWIHLRLN